MSIPEVSLTRIEACDGWNYSIPFFPFMQSYYLDKMRKDIQGRTTEEGFCLRKGIKRERG